ncbi:MAG: ClbS/DfsB family four-helix bundle protein [Chloroflexi bacterium]|nr:ClbS/DfsB family four-helix bundle protein [Chloroflexota bacterium]
MSENHLPVNKAELMNAIESEWTALMKVVGHLNEKQMTAPDAGGWSPKDNLAHLGEWMKILMGYHMDHRPPHEVLNVSPDVTKDWDMDVINPVIFERNRNRSVKDVIDELKRTYAELTAKLTSMPFEDLMKPRHADDPEKRPLLNWVLGDTSDHFAEHRETIERTLKTD